MSNWRSLLIKTELSPSAVEGCCRHLSGSEQVVWLAELKIPVDSPANLKKLRATMKKVKPLLPSELFASMEEEMREIAEDARWAKTERGKYVCAINEWADPILAEFRKRAEFCNVSVGGHAKREVVYASGFVESQEVFRELLTFIHASSPPFKVSTDVRIGSWSGPKALP